MNPKYALIAACMMYVEGYYSIKSIAYRNNNPGNIELSSGQMRKFDTKLDGFEFLVGDIAANRGKTLMEFITKYAPPNENETNVYIQVVSALSGVQPTDIL